MTTDVGTTREKVGGVASNDGGAAAGDAPEDGTVPEATVIAFVTRYLEERGLHYPEDPPITADTPLVDLGLDSVSVIDLLLAARERVIADGRVPHGPALVDLPHLESVADLTALVNRTVAVTP